MRALVVEDEPKVASFITKELQAHAFVVDVARDGLEGERMAREQIYDIILLDWMMPRKRHNLLIAWQYVACEPLSMRLPGNASILRLMYLQHL